MDIKTCASWHDEISIRGNQKTQVNYKKKFYKGISQLQLAAEAKWHGGTGIPGEKWG